MRAGGFLLVVSFTALAMSPAGLQAGETIIYKYDALGRLVQTTQSGDVNDGVITGLTYDPAGNRTDYVVAGSDGSDNSGATGATGGTGGTSGGGETPPSFAIANDTKTEGSNLVFTVTKTGTVTGSYSVNYTTTEAPNSATSGSDYTPVSGTLSFGATDTDLSITVATTDDTEAEAVEKFYVDLSSATGGATISDPQAVGSIDDNDSSGNIPPVANDDLKIIARCYTSHTGLTGNDTDQDGNVPLAIVSGSLVGPSWVTHSTTHPNSHVSIVAPNVTVTTFFTVQYTIQDTLGATDTGTLTIDVRAFGATC